MHWPRRLSLALALLAGLATAVWLVWAVGIGAVFAAIARAGIGGLALLCLYSLLVIAILALAWSVLLPVAQRRGFAISSSPGWCAIPSPIFRPFPLSAAWWQRRG